MYAIYLSNTYVTTIEANSQHDADMMARRYGDDVIATKIY